MRLVLAAALLAAFTTGSAAAAVTEDFEGFAAGASLNGASVLGGLGTVTSGSPLQVFDTTNPTGGDDDLAFSPLSGNVLIIQEQGASEPDDNARGGTFSFSFSRPVSLLSVMIRDIEEGKGISFFNGAAESQNLILATDCGNNGCVETISFAGLAAAEGLSQLTVRLAGSGAIDNVMTTPIPGALVLFGTGVAALGYVRRRRAA